MKLRIKDNTIRLRLSIQELDDLCQGISQSMSTPMVKGELLTILRPSESEGFSAIDDGEFLIDIPQQRFADLKASDDEGFQLDLGESSISIEKDFACIGRSEESNQGLFDNPRSNDGAC